MARKNEFKAMFGLTKDDAYYILNSLINDSRNTYSSVHDTYGRPSSTKVAIEERILRNGNDKGMKAGSYRVLSRNTFMFTCAYIFNNNGEEYVHYETPSKTLEFPVEFTKY